MEIELKQAEVVLKKTKITKSIVSQLICRNLMSLEKYKVCGWVLHENTRKIILYDEGSKDLTFRRMPKRVVLDNISSSFQSCVAVTLYSGKTVRLAFDTVEEAKKACRLYERLRNNAESVGQIFI